MYAYAHMRTGTPDIGFFCFHTFYAKYCCAARWYSRISSRQILRRVSSAAGCVGCCAFETMRSRCRLHCRVTARRMYAERFSAKPCSTMRSIVLQVVPVRRMECSSLSSAYREVYAGSSVLDVFGRSPVSREWRSMPICSVIACRAKSLWVLQNPVSTKLSAIQRVLLFMRYFMISSDTICAGTQQRFWRADARAFRFFPTGFSLRFFWLLVLQWFFRCSSVRGKRVSSGLSARRGSRLFGWRASRLKSGCKTRIFCLFRPRFSDSSMVVFWGNKGLPRCFLEVIRVWFSGFWVQVFGGVFRGYFCVAQGLLCGFLCFLLCGLCLGFWVMRGQFFVFQVFSVFFFLRFGVFTKGERRVSGLRKPRDALAAQGMSRYAVSAKVLNLFYTGFVRQVHSCLVLEFE